MFLVGVCASLPFVSMIAGIFSTCLATMIILIICLLSLKSMEESAPNSIGEILKRHQVKLIYVSVALHMVTILYFFLIFGSKGESQFETSQLVMVLLSSTYVYLAVFFIASSYKEDRQAGSSRGITGLYLELARLFFWFLMIGKRK